LIRGTEQLHLAQNQFHLENFSDIDKQIEQLMAATYMPGQMLELDYQSKPSFLKALAYNGFNHDLVLIKPENFNGLAGMGIRSLRRAYLGGRIQPVGYLHHLRLHPEIRGGLYLARGYRAVKQFFLRQPAKLTITSILEENQSAQDLLEKNKAEKIMPQYQRIARFLTALIPLHGPGQRWPARFRQSIHHNENPARAKNSKQNPTVRMLGHQDLEELCRLFQEAGKVNDGLPAIESASFRRGDFPNLTIEDFVGIFSNSRLIAACGIWNQQQDRQIVVRKLGTALKMTQKIWRYASPLVGRCPIPDEGHQVNQALLDPWAILPGFEKRFSPLLLKEACATAKMRNFDFAAWGVSEAHPAIEAAKCVFFIPYWSIMYQVYWPEIGAYDFGEQQLQLTNLGAL
jgi:hypothetical protein